MAPRRAIRLGGHSGSVSTSLSTAYRNRSRRRLARLSGPVAAAVTIGSILLATGLSATFRWETSALSDLGTVGATSWLFNGGLVLGCLLGLPYGWALWTAAADRLGSIRAGAFVAALLSMAGVGLFPAGETLHVPFAVAFFLLSALTLVVDGVARFRLPTGKLSLGAGITSPAAWPVWLLLVVPGGGIAVPEFVGAVLFAVWIIALSPERVGGDG